MVDYKVKCNGCSINGHTIYKPRFEGQVTKEGWRCNACIEKYKRARNSEQWCKYNEKKREQEALIIN